MTLFHFNNRKGHRIWSTAIQLPDCIEKPLTKYIRKDFNNSPFGRTHYQSVDATGRECRHFIRLWRFSLITTVEVPR